MMKFQIIEILSVGRNAQQFNRDDGSFRNFWIRIFFARQLWLDFRVSMQHCACKHPFEEQLG